MDDLFFTLSKLIWSFARPDHLLLLLLSLAVGWLAWGSRRRWAARVAYLLLGLFWLIALFPWGDLLMAPLEQRFKTPDSLEKQPLAGIVVLGGAESLGAMERFGRAEFTDAAERVMAVPELARRFPELPIIYSCGSGWLLEQRFKGADYTRLYFDAMGLQDRVLYERESRNTYENATLSLALAQGRHQQPWLLVTSAFHMPRSVGVFRHQGWQVVPYPVDYRGQSWSQFGLYFSLGDNLEGLTMAVREWLGLLAYWLTDKTTVLLPEPRPGG